MMPTCESWVMTHDSSWNDLSWNDVFIRHMMTYSFVIRSWLGRESHEWVTKEPTRASWVMTHDSRLVMIWSYSFVTWKRIHSWPSRDSGGRVTDESRINTSFHGNTYIYISNIYRLIPYSFAIHSWLSLPHTWDDQKKHGGKDSIFIHMSNMLYSYEWVWNDAFIRDVTLLPTHLRQP